MNRQIFHDFLKVIGDYWFAILRNRGNSNAAPFIKYMHRYFYWRDQNPYGKEREIQIGRT